MQLPAQYWVSSSLLVLWACTVVYRINRTPFRISFKTLQWKTDRVRFTFSIIPPFPNPSPPVNHVLEISFRLQHVWVVSWNVAIWQYLKPSRRGSLEVWMQPFSFRIGGQGNLESEPPERMMIHRITYLNNSIASLHSIERYADMRMKRESTK